MIIVPLLVLLFSRIHAVYARIGAALRLGQTPPQPRRRSSLVIVPVGSMSLLTEEGISAALSLGDDVVAVTVCYADRDDAQVDANFRDQWEEWHPDVPLRTLRSQHRSLGPPIVEFLRDLERPTTITSWSCSFRRSSRPGHGRRYYITSAASCWNGLSSAARRTWSSAGSDTGWRP